MIYDRCEIKWPRWRRVMRAMQLRRKDEKGPPGMASMNPPSREVFRVCSFLHLFPFLYLFLFLVPSFLVSLSFSVVSPFLYTFYLPDRPSPLPPNARGSPETVSSQIFHLRFL